ncbi:MAG: hypothetical protein R3324_13960, partial [Halobacteriales archaeon]|nr:hypothetical protein [Halobacteriales archaeon]
FTFEGAPLFVSGQSDISLSVSTIDIARMGAEQGINGSVVAPMLTSFGGPLVRAGGPYDPAETGSAQASIDKVSDDNGRFGIFGWSAGHVPVDQIILQELFGKELTEEGGDIRAQPTEPPAIPQLVMQDELAMGWHSPAHGSGGRLLAQELVPLYWGAEELSRNNFGMAPLANIATRPAYLEENREAVEAFLRAFNQGVTWFYDSGVDDIPGNETYMEPIGAGSAEEARYTVEWVISNDVPLGYETDTPRLHNPARVTQSWIDQNTAFMDRAADIGQVPSNWQEFVAYEQV